MYNINFEKFVQERLPGDLRQLITTAWLLVLVTPVRYLHAQFLSFRSNVERDITITGSVRILRFWANHFFDPTEQRITIEDYVNNDIDYIYLDADNQPLYLPEFLSASNYDFEVCVPIEYEVYEVQIRAYLDKYKLVTKSYLLTFKVM